MKIAPHGNARSGQSYVRTMPSVMCKLKKEAKKKTPKRALQFVSKEAGGILEATSAGALPRSRQQIKDARRKVTSKQDYDPLYSVMYMCKEGEGTGGDTFIRMVNAAPFPMMLIAFDYTLDDLVRFCTSPTCFSILGIDPTFNLGEFDVTITTYRHLLLHQQGNPGGKPPVMVGPMFIHVRKDFSTYHFFSSSLVGQRQQLSSLQAFGTDGELALENAFMATFPRAQHIRCFLHFRGNVERKLQDLGVPRSVLGEIVKDIMGCPTQLQHGLVDAESAEKLDDMLSGLARRWNEFEKPYNSPPSFHSWFIRHCRDNVVNCMLQDVREKAGLGSPPTPYYTNEVESKNKLLKEEVEYKSSQLPEFLEKMKRLMEGQKQEIERAIIGSGEYRLRKEYHNLAVESSKWFKMTTEQRQRKIDRFMKATIQVNPPTDSNCPLDLLTLPSQLKKSLWEKANDLVKDETAIVRAPGDGDESAWMVKSYSGKRPHFVKITKCTFACDEQCLSYKLMKLCSHTIALAIKKDCVENFLKWYRTMKYQPNFTTLAEAGKPSTAGKKPTRKGVSKKGAEHVRKLVADAEGSNSAWQPRGGLSGSVAERECMQESLTDNNLFDCDFSLPSGSPNPALLQDNPQSVAHPATTTTLVMSPRGVHSINIGSVGGIVSGPPPLIPAEFGQSVYQPSPTSNFVAPQPSLNSSVHSNFVVPQSSPSTSFVIPQPSPNSSFIVPQPSLSSNFVVSQSSAISPQQQRPRVDTPFWMVFIFGNVSRCNGCKGRISRGEDKKPLPPPDDIVLGHKEYIVYHNSKTGNFEQSREKRNVYYHPWRTCIAPNFCDFDPTQHIIVPDSVRGKLLTVYKALILREFSVHV